MSKLILPRRRLLRLAAPALVLPYRRVAAQTLPGPGPGMPAAPPAPPWTLISSTTATNTTGTSTVMPAINTSTANLLVACFSMYNNDVSGITDNKGNLFSSWNEAFGSPISSGYTSQKLFYIATPAVGTNHILTLTIGTGGFGSSFIVAAFKSGSGTPAYANVWGNQSNITGGTTISLPSITPMNANELVITAMVDQTAANTYSIDSGFSIVAQVMGAGGAVASALGWKVQGTSAIAPTWSWTPNATVAAGAQESVMGSF